MKKRALCLFLSLITCLIYCPFSVSKAAESTVANILEYDSRSDETEYVITSAEGIMKFSSLASETTFKGVTINLLCDVDMSDFSYVPFTSFSGTFNGNYNSIKNIEMVTFCINTGFFGAISSSGVVKNLGMESGSIIARVSADSERIGSIAGINRGLIENCWSTVSVTGARVEAASTGDISVGGIAGGLTSNGTVKNSYFAGSVTGVDHAAGISDWCQGQNENTVGKIINCFEAGRYSATTVYPLGRYSTSILEANKTGAIVNSYYFHSGTVYSWAGAKKYTKAQLGSGELAYLLDNGASSSRTRNWKKGAYFPVLGENVGVYPLTVKTKTSDGGSTSVKMYMNAGDKYTVAAGSSTCTLSSSSGSISNNTYTMPASAATLTVTLSIPNVSAIDSVSASEYVVTNFDGFKALGSYINGGKGTLAEKTIYMIHDIDMGNASHTPIGIYGSGSGYTKSFSGSFIGNRFKIFNLNVNNTSLNGAGLFGSSKDAYFEKVGIFNGSVTANNRAGGITGYGDSCVFKGCYNGADITTTAGVDGCGGIAGVSRYSSEFHYCYNFGTITAKVKAAAGISGWGQDNVIAVGCFNVGTVTAPESYTALIRTNEEYTTAFDSCFYLSETTSVNGGTAYSFISMTKSILACKLNTLSGTVSNKKVFTDTPLFPFLKTENDGYAVVSKIKAQSEKTGEELSTKTIYGNSGEKVAVMEGENFYATTPAILNKTTVLKVTEPQYSISYVLNGGVIGEDYAKLYYPSVSTILPQNVTKNGYVFMGWYEDSGMKTSPAVCISKNSLGNKTFYAKWGKETLISSVSELSNLVSEINNGKETSSLYIKLGANLNLSKTSLSPIGTSKYPFMGVFDGNGYIISNQTIEAAEDNRGFIGYLNGGIVKNLFFENSNIKGDSNLGGIVGYNKGGVVYNCGLNGKITSNSQTAEIGIMSFNIRTPNDPSPNALSDRLPRVKTFLANYSPDIIGMQEVTSAWKTQLDTILKDYNKEFIYRATSSQEAAPLYWKKSKFNCLEQASFWLSETPDVESKSWNSAYYRTCSYAVLQEKTSGKIILAFNTHLDNKSLYARVRGMELIVSKMKLLEEKYIGLGYEQISAFLTGDFNSKPNTVPHDVIKTYLSDSRTVADKMLSPAGTLTSNAFTSFSGSSLIDYIYVDDYDMDILTYKVCNEDSYGGFVSDHFGVYITASLTDKAVGGIVGLNKGSIVNCYFNGNVNGKFCSGGIAGDNYGSVVGGYAVSTITSGDESGGVVGINRGIVDKTYYFSNLTKGSYKVSSGISKTEEQLKNSVSDLNKFGQWKTLSYVNGAYPVQKIMKAEKTLSLKSSSKYLLKDGMLLNVKSEETKEAVFANFENEGLVIEGNVSTGASILLKDKDTVLDSAVIVILGDVDGSGEIDSTDYLRLKSALLSQITLEGAYYLAADADKDGSLSSSDYLRLKSHFLGDFNLYE